MDESIDPTDDALLFFREVVEPTVAEFMFDRANKRRACLACLAMAAMTEHYFYAYQEYRNLSKKAIQDELAKFKGKIRKESPPLGKIAEVANATKHVLQDERKGKLGYNDIGRYPLNLAGIMRAGWPVGGYEILVGPHPPVRLTKLLEAAGMFWRRKLELRS